MVEFLKAKTTSFVNKPIGIVGVDTGARQAGETLAKVGQELATRFFAQAEKEQIKLGKEVGLTLPVRDVNNKLIFQEVPTSLSEVARNAAQPLIQKKYEDALNVDIFNKINEIRSKSKTSSEFTENVNSEMGSYIDQTRISGGNRYVSGMTQTIAKLSAQHLNAYLTDEKNEADKIASLKALEITNVNTNDLISLATNDLSNVDASGFDGMISDLEINSKEISDANDTNFTVNNLDGKKYGVAKANAKSAVGVALANVLLKDKSAAEAIEIQSFFFNGKMPEHLLNEQGEVSEKNKKIFNYINKSPYRKQIYEHIKKGAELIGKDQARTRADIQYTQNVEDKNLQKKSQSSENMMASDKFLDNKVSEINDITDDLLASDSISEDQIKKFKDWETSIYKTVDKKGSVVNIDGKQTRIMVGKPRADDVLVKAMLRGIENTILDSGEFGTVNDKIKLRNALSNRSTAGLNEKQKKIVNRIQNMTKLSNRSNTLISNIALNLGNNISDQNSLVVANEKVKKHQQVFNSFTGVPSANLYGNTSAELKIMDQILDINPTYFDGEFQKKLQEGDSKAEAIDEALNKGNFTNAFLTYMSNSINSGNPIQVKNALNYFNRYTQLNKGGMKVDSLQGKLDHETYAILKVASAIIPLYEGQPSFFGVQGEGPQGNVTAGQMMLKINQAYNTRQNKENNDVYKTNLKKIVGDYKNAYAYLLNEEFDPNEAEELRFIVDASAAMGLSKTQTDSLLTEIKENVYLDGENIIYDALGSGNDNKRSKHAFMRIFNTEQATVIRGFIQNALDGLVHKNEKGRTVGRFVLHFKPTQVIDGKVQYSMGTDVGETEDIDVEDTIVKLQPVNYGSTSADVSYVAVVKDIRTGDMKPIKLPNGLVLRFFAKDLAEIDTIYGEE